MFPVKAAKMHAIRVDSLDALLGTNQADFTIVKHQNDDWQFLAHRGLQFCHRHQKAAIAGKGNNRSGRMGDTRRQCTRNRISHRAKTIGCQKFAGAVTLPFLYDEQTTGAGITGGNGVAWQNGPGQLNRALR